MNKVPAVIMVASLAFMASGCHATEAATKVYGYRCSSADGHTYSLIARGENKYSLYIQGAGSQVDQSDIVFANNSVTDIETNGGVEKQAQVEKLFRLIVKANTYEIKDGEASFLKSPPHEQCKFDYSYQLSP